MTNLTQLLGMFGFILSCIFCSYALCKAFWRKVGTEHLLCWFALLILSSLSFVEIQFSFRFYLKKLFVEAFVNQSPYSERVYLQIILGCILLAISTKLTAMFFRNRKYPVSLKMAVFGSALTYVLFLVEIISLHSVDTFIYFKVLDVMIIGWLWNLCALLIALGAYMEVKQSITA